MIKNIIFDIGNVILNFKLSEVLPYFAKDEKEEEFIIKNIIESPEWLGNALIDTGYISKENAISIVEDRTNHINDELIEKFWNNYNKYSKINEEVVKLIKKLKNSGYKIYLLSNINEHTYDSIKENELFNIIDGYIFSYIEHKVKPYKSIYLSLLDKYKLIPSECLFIDDKEENVKTANTLGILGRNVMPDCIESIKELLEKYNINY